MAQARARTVSGYRPARVSTRWERRRYALWAPVYDALVAPLRRARQASLRALAPAAGERLLLVGAGTGEDLPFIPAGVRVSAVDLTPAMLVRARRRARPPEHAAVMDAEALGFRDGAFDAVALHLIVAVVSDPPRCFAEAARVCRPGGRIVVFDKFVAPGRRASPLRRLLNRATRPLGTDITRRLGDAVAASGARVSALAEEPALGGTYSISLFRRD
jgi:ubiquinone/menaquinone biosynthesis C-methylase UbiE